jgi:hypothetical protein
MLDSINTEIDDMAEVVAQEEAIIDDAPLSDEDEYGELDTEVFLKSKIYSWILRQLRIPPSLRLRSSPKKKVQKPKWMHQ